MDPLISVLAIQDPQSNPGKSLSCLSLQQFEDFLESRPNYDLNATQQLLYVVQAPSRCYETSKLRHLLRSKLGVPDHVFQIHQWRQTAFHFNENINCHRLPTTLYPKANYSLEYYELWSVDDALLGRHMGNTDTVICTITGRHIQCHKWSNSSSWLMIAPRKCTYWAAMGAPDGPVVILYDPPPTIVKSYNNPKIKLEIKAFEGGYHGFIPDYALGTTLERPRHYSLAGDLIYYVQQHAQVAESSLLPSLFLRKIVASHYCELLGFVSHQTASMRSAGWAVQRRTQKEIDESDQIETAWSHFKCPDYLEALGTVLDSLGVSQGHDPYDAFDVDSVNPGGSPALAKPSSADWRSSGPDFLYLHRQFRAQLSDYARMTSSLAALNGMIGGRISLLEARTARSLTLVAMLFAPLSFVASIFSIPLKDFGHDGPRFWMYWAAAVPLTVLVFLSTYLVHERDGIRRAWHARMPRSRTSDKLHEPTKV